jgi:light-regulated signal transduction histidine kinase (bacteriophytochrome)
MELEQFTYVASHDLQEPIRLISNYIGLLLSTCKQSLDEEAKKYLNICKDSTVRMHELVFGLLEYAKLGQGVEQFDRVDCNQAMSKALLNLQKVIKETNAKVSNNDLPEIYGKSIAITSLFQNLISNAIKYQKKNSIPQIEIEAKPYGQYWLFKFTDNGIGIDKQHLNKIFMPFKRVYSKYEFPGTGMGLAICKRIINRHQGEIWVESTLEQGSSFYFTIPKIWI